VVAFVYNLVAMRSVGAQFRPVPLREVQADVEVMSEADRLAAERDAVVRR
jgi:predicted urease superfamily metal-dependent hydrolase